MNANVLLSSAGRRVALLRSFRDALGAMAVPGRVVATDISRTSSAFHAADDGVVVPRCTTAEFVPALLDICREQEIRVVVPTIDTELPMLAEHRDRFAAEGVTVSVSDPATVAIGADKVLTHRWLVDHGFPTVRQTDPASVAAAPGDWPYPLLVKPRLGSASIGVAVVGDAAELGVATRGGDVVVQTLAAGQEHTVDVYVDIHGTVLEAVPRRRLEVRAGEVSKAVTVRDAVLEELAREIARALPGAFGALNVQLFRDERTGALAVIEVNARFGGGYPLADAAGATFPRWLLEDALGLPRSIPTAPWRDGVVMLRYDDAVFVDRTGAGL